ncbi:hypothetical protein A3860_31060 [Niastella vici]|uniref:Uncharacterized protein n=1 Tax=Niastella vici TaxID=1703345 RepID=A0A1V9FTY5_9BACT|nr:hypothetical protein [Niastella vici]OQP61706.1 hypothetical protein A3860_31060 [Niastella vici]
MKSLTKVYSLPAIFALIIINGCTPNMMALKGNYGTSQFEITSNKSADTLWLTVTKLFAEKGLAIDKVDKKKGLIVSKKTSFIPAYTFEDNNGKISNGDAWVVLNKVSVKEKEWIPKTIYSQWNIRILETGAGATTIKIDPVVICRYYPNSFTKVEVRGQSTGRLEALIKGS